MSLQGILLLLNQVLVVAAIIHVVMDNRQPAKTIAWALVIYFVPVVGIVAYILFGVNTRRERTINRRTLDMLSRRSMLGFVEQANLNLPTTHKPLIDLFVEQDFSLPFNDNKVELIGSGYEFFPCLLRDIASASSHIHIDIYIFEEDALGQLVADALIAKANEGVEVRLIYDDVGCWGVKNKFFERMREAGIEVEAFLPVRFPSFASKVNYRNHRKIFVIDGLIGYIGGMNIANRYVQGKPGQLWRDTMARIEGRGVYSLQRIFLTDWYFVDSTLLSDKKYYPVPSSPITHHPTPNTPDGRLQGLLQTVTSSPTSPAPNIMQGYVRIILSARRYIYIETPYFLPNSTILFALTTAASAGVDVRLLVPIKSDARFTEWASRSYLREAAEAGISVMFYQEGFLHSKLMVCDDEVCTCGSTNVDFRSFENNFEANTFFFDQTLAQQMRDMYLADEQQALPLNDLPERSHPSFAVRLGESFARLFSPLL